LAGCQGGSGPNGSEPDSIAEDEKRVCVDKGFWSGIYDFGFDPPDGFYGPADSDTAPETAKIGVDFEHDRLLKINLVAEDSLLGFDEFLLVMLAYRDGQGYEALDLAPILLESGERAAMAEYLVRSEIADVYLVELWAVSNGMSIHLLSVMLPADYASFGSDIRRSFRSLCVE
jgi:hypothetical protein